MNEEGPMDLGLRTRRFALAVLALSRQCARDEDTMVLRRQMVRSGTSVGAQYREARRARSDAEFVSKMESSLQELDETGYWMELLRDANLGPPALLNSNLSEVDELIRIFVRCIKNVKESGA